MQLLIVIAVVVSLSGSSVLAQQASYAPVAPQPTLVEQASDALRALPPVPRPALAVPALTAAAQATPSARTPYYKKPWFWVIVVAVPAAIVIIKKSIDNSQVVVV